MVQHAVAPVTCDEWNLVPTLTQIGWWASAADIYNTAPSKNYRPQDQVPVHDGFTLRLCRVHRQLVSA